MPLASTGAKQIISHSPNLIAARVGLVRIVLVNETLAEAGGGGGGIVLEMVLLF